jgi:hypothetical protein
MPPHIAASVGALDDKAYASDQHIPTTHEHYVKVVAYYTLDPKRYTLFPVPYFLYPIPYTPYPIPYTLYKAYASDQHIPTTHEHYVKVVTSYMLNPTP